MGKKKDKNKPSRFDMMYGGGKLGQAMDRYDVDRLKSVKPSARNLPEHFRTEEDFNKELARKAMNDYDTRRTLEAAGLAGNKKAAKMSAKGFKNASDVLDAQAFFKKAHKKERGLGGSFSSASDFAGLTDYYVNKDRDALLEKAQGMVPDAPETPLEKAQETFDRGSTNTLSPEAAKAFGTVQAYESRARGEGDYSFTDARFGDSGTQEAAAQELADAYKAGVKKRLSPDFKMDRIFT